MPKLDLTTRIKTCVHVGVEDLIYGLRRVGVQAGDTILCHSSLSKFGYVEGGAETVVDALAAVVGDAVVPETGLMNVSSRRQSPTGRDTDRAVRVGVRKSGAARGETVDVRRLDQGMAVAAGFVPAVLIRHDEEEVGRFQGSISYEDERRLQSDFEYMQPYREIQGLCITPVILTKVKLHSILLTESTE